MKDKVLGVIAQITELAKKGPQNVKSDGRFEFRDPGYHQRMVESSVKRLKDYLVELASQDKEHAAQLIKLSEQLNNEDLLPSTLDEINQLLAHVKLPQQIAFHIPSNLPDDIRGEVSADINELQKCYNSQCYRSCVILCGRILETCLHRLYYEHTGLDILEKNPGIGLGKLIAKLTEKNVAFDPGITQQIHLVNNVRIFSVHKKQTPFQPSKAQVDAIVLYTLDAIEKIFTK